MRTHLIAVGIICLAPACHDGHVRKEQPTELSRAQAKYAAWADKQPRPAVELVNKIEALLQRQPCVSRLDLWSRFYAYDYDLQTKTLYPHIVAFHLEEAGSYGVRPGRHVTEPYSWANIDDRPIKMAGGDYDIAEDRLRFSFCGDNVGVTKPEIDNMRTYWKELDKRRARRR